MITLQNLDDLFLKLFMSNPCAMAISELDSGKYVVVNDALLHILGYEKADVIGKTVLELSLFADINKYYMARQLLRKDGYLRNFEALINGKNNRLINGVFTVDLFINKGITYFLSVMHDITAKKQLEQEIPRLEKLNIIGQMSAGISHEVRNPMTTVRGFLQLLRKKVEYANHKEYFDLMISELDRANLIMSDFLSITKDEQIATKYERQSLHELLEKIYPLINADALEKNMQLEYLISDLPPIIMNDKEIRQLVFNLARNGFDAMTAGGTLTIKAACHNDCVTLTVEDQGTGIDKSILDKLGTAFLTTKKNGTGLGLAICFDIVERHNATIHVDTSPKGTVFEICFPLCP
jgi:PAS domain S-box-containing protein